METADCVPAPFIFVDIGLDSILVDSLNYPVTILEEDTVRKLLPERPRDGHKGTFGKVFLLAGSKPYPGAPIMASHTATHSGAGLALFGHSGDDLSHHRSENAWRRCR